MSRVSNPLWLAQTAALEAFNNAAGRIREQLWTGLVDSPLQPYSPAYDEKQMEILAFVDDMDTHRPRVTAPAHVDMPDIPRLAVVTSAVVRDHFADRDSLREVPNPKAAG